jgi:hypothetical protein
MATTKKTIKKPKSKPEIEVEVFVKEYKPIPTLYDQLLNNFIELGYEVEEGSWVEETGYDKPTTEYWFDVTLLFDLPNKKKITGHYFFGPDKNAFIDHSVWTMDITIEESNTVKITR